MTDAFKYDVFLSHSAKDKAVVRPLADRFWMMWMALMFLCCAAFEAKACMQGYESPESLVKRARLIMELEVLSTTNAPPPITNAEPFSMVDDDPRNRTNAVAEVKVVRVIKGRCLTDRFTLIGGPFDTCSPYFSYVQFNSGKRVYLIVDHELPKDLKAVLVNWRCRVLSREGGDIAAVIEHAGQAWRRQVDWHKKTAPDSFDRAQALNQDAQVMKSERVLCQESYAVLACLRVLQTNPDDLPPWPLIPAKSSNSTNAQKYAAALPFDFQAGQLIDGVYHTVQHESSFIPQVLSNALQFHLARHQEDVIAFNQGLFQRFLVDEIALTPEKASALISTTPSTNVFAQVGFNPCKCELNHAEKANGMLNGLEFALGLADDEPDTLVWRTFGMSMSRGVNIDPTFIANVVEKHPERDYSAWSRMIVLLSAPDVRTSSVVQKYLNQEQNIYRLENYLNFFLKLGQYPQARKVLDQFERIAVDDLRNASSDEDKKRARESLASQFKGISVLVETDASRDPGLVEQMHQLKKRIAEQRL